MRALLVVLVLWPAVARADDDHDLARSYSTAASTCSIAVKDARETLTWQRDADDPAPAEDLDALRGYADDLQPHCDALQHDFERLVELLDDRDHGAAFATARDELPGKVQVVAPKETAIDEAVDRIRLMRLPDLCRGGQATMCGELGDLYAKRKQKKLAKKYRKLAVKMLEQSCRKQHDDVACANLSDAYEYAELGLKKSTKKAKKYRALAERYRPYDPRRGVVN